MLSNAVMEVDKFLCALQRPAGANLPQEGDTVTGSDRGDLGTIDEVVVAESSSEMVGYMKVTRGVILDKDTYNRSAEPTGSA